MVRAITIWQLACVYSVQWRNVYDMSPGHVTASLISSFSTKCQTISLLFCRMLFPVFFLISHQFHQLKSLRLEYEIPNFTSTIQFHMLRWIYWHIPTSSITWKTASFERNVFFRVSCDEVVDYFCVCSMLNAHIRCSSTSK